MNVLNATDFYKTGHIKQYPEGTQGVYSNFTCRSDKHANVLPDFSHKTVLFGLQGFINTILIKMWNDEFFKKNKADVIARYKRRMDTSLGPDAVSMKHISALHDLGYLPIRIKSLPEGSRVNIRVPLFTIENTHPDFSWLTNYLETQISAEMWKPITTATIAYEYKRLLTNYANATGSPLDFVPWQGHDFSFRGMSGLHDAEVNGAAHLTSFTGTDTIPAIDYLEDNYGHGEWGKAPDFIGGSVPATEHSVMCMGGSETEIQTFSRLISDVYPSGIVSIVSDTWDFWKVLTEYTVTLKDDILKREGKVVFRPDSGDPVKIICGDPDAKFGTPEYKGAVECLWDVFGGLSTQKGYRLLDSHVGLIYGDSITLERAQQILKGLAEKGFASGNIVFGIGSFTYQHVTRDTFGSAIKATFGRVNGTDRELWKDPKTDDGVKKSLRGLIRIEKEGDDFVAYDRQTREDEEKGLLETVFCDGVLMKHQSLSEIRKLLEV